MILARLWIGKRLDIKKGGKLGIGIAEGSGQRCLDPPLIYVDVHCVLGSGF